MISRASSLTVRAMRPLLLVRVLPWSAAPTAV
jgi:hypothetical protein